MPGQPAGGASLRTPMAYEEYRALGETKHHEYYHGLCVVNPPSRTHSRAQSRVVDLLRPHCPATHEVLTGWGWHVGRELDFKPDIMVTDRSSADDDVLRDPPPLLVVEISSPSTRDIDFGTKGRAYAAAAPPGTGSSILCGTKLSCSKTSTGPSWKRNGSGSQRPRQAPSRFWLTRPS